MSKGSILIYTSAAGQAAPLPGVTLTVTDAGGSVRARLVTDADGFAEAADLPAPDAAYSLDAANTTVHNTYILYLNNAYFYHFLDFLLLITLKVEDMNFLI